MQSVCRAEPTGDIRRDRKEGNTLGAAGRPKVNPAGEAAFLTGSRASGMGSEK
jgi:hypothetical protein